MDGAGTIAGASEIFTPLLMSLDAIRHVAKHLEMETNERGY